jgi:HD-GYP domain-containing protein (c-di-GMP phosphodiesterase class II)
MDDIATAPAAPAPTSRKRRSSRQTAPAAPAAKSRKRTNSPQTAAGLRALNQIAVALSAERNIDSLLELILTKSREITVADAGSIYLLEQTGDGEQELIFQAVECFSRDIPFQRFTLPVDTHSIAGYVAVSGKALSLRDVYRIRGREFHFRRDFDQRTGYRTTSVLAVPLKNQKDEVLGVLQLINAKRRASAKLLSDDDIARQVIPFSKRSEGLAASLASQAAVALENAQLYRGIENLFEGFVKASITAIESRDPSTYGHSERVAKLTLALAESVNRCDNGTYGGVHFSVQDMQELRYASLLHDFGKVGVREHVLVKAKRLYPHQMEVVQQRFRSARMAVELASERAKLNFLFRNGRNGVGAFFEVIDSERDAELGELDAALKVVAETNEPSATSNGNIEKLTRIPHLALCDGKTEPLLTSEEVRLLSIPRGTLAPEERAEIESHVEHGFRFLSQIPWTKELRKIPAIAVAHHERLDGSGYPAHVTGEKIPFQARMIAISDVYDALTALDRPYRRAVPVNTALDIIAQEVDSTMLDADLFRLFIESKVYEITAKT